MTTLTSLKPSLASARQLCAQTVPHGGPNPWHGAADALDGTHCLEQGYVFSRIPAGLPLRAQTQFQPGEPTGSLLVQFRDDEGFLVLEAWTKGVANGSTDDAAMPGAPVSRDLVSAELMAAYAADQLDSGELRRFRVRIWRPVPEGMAADCTLTVLQHYRQDGRAMVDVAMSCTLADGRLAARAWASYASIESGAAMPSGRLSTTSYS